MENAGSLMDDAGHPRSVLCDNLEGWGRRWAQEGGDTSVPVADSYWCMAKPSRYCKLIILQLKQMKFKKEKISQMEFIQKMKYRQP